MIMKFFVTLQCESKKIIIKSTLNLLDLSKRQLKIMTNEISKKEALTRIAAAFTLCNAHNDDSSEYHELAVYVASALWMLTYKDSLVSEGTLRTVEREIRKL